MTGKIISNRKINRLFIVDDDSSTRNSIKELLRDSGYEIFTQEDSVSDLQKFLAKSITQYDAIISDHQMRKKDSYFPINGAEFVSKCYERNIPSILMTRYENAQLSEIRRYKKNIPVLINPHDFEVDMIDESLEKCINEFKGTFKEDRKLHRTLVRIDEVSDDKVYIIIPAFDPYEVLSLDRNEFPHKFMDLIRPDARFFVNANIGCENQNELYFQEWEIK